MEKMSHSYKTRKSFQNSAEKIIPFKYWGQSWLSWTHGWEQVQNLLRRLGNIENVTVNPTFGTNEVFSYRTKIVLYHGPVDRASTDTGVLMKHNDVKIISIR